MVRQKRELAQAAKGVCELGVLELRYYAHTLPPPATKQEWEPLEAHLRNVANVTAKFTGAFDAADWGRILGLWHDLGKYSFEFQRYLFGSGDGHEADVLGRVDHSTAGAQHACSQGKVGRLLAYCIAGHHAGLPDDTGGNAALLMRLTKKVPTWNSAPPEIVEHAIPSLAKLKHCGDGRRAAFAVAFFVRMLFSALVDADFLATEEFMDPQRAATRPGQLPAPADLLARLDHCLDVLEGSAPRTHVNRCRHAVLAACRQKATMAPGMFSLDVPTGGAKTLSSLAFGLTHAATHNLNRVIYAIPFTSIIEQTANVFREALADMADQVLEYHSNLDHSIPERQSERSRLAAENFDARLIVTTNVQLFESMFASRTSQCRKLHRLAKSVIILDEAQTLPPELLAPTLAALDELVRNYGTTVVLCTATQPAVENRHDFPIGLSNVRPIIDSPAQLHAGLRRTNVIRVGRLSNEQLAAELAGHRQVLCIVNSRRHAADLVRLLGDDALHLSASMCPAHRADIVAEIRRRLSANEPCRVVSTQVIEAGIDVDFPTVYRASAGLDSIAQAAGRCNREGRLTDGCGKPRLGRVVVFEYDEKEHPPPAFVRNAACRFRELAPDHADDLLSPAAIEAFFRLRYWQQGGEDGRGWDRGTGGQSVMECFGGVNCDPLHHQFRQAAERYRLIDEQQVAVIVPYKARGAELIRELQDMPELPDPKRLHGFDRAAQRYAVGVRERDLQRLVDCGIIQERHNRYYLMFASAYEQRIGLNVNATRPDATESVI